MVISNIATCVLVLLSKVIPMAVCISRKENKIVVKFDYSADRIAKIKSYVNHIKIFYSFINKDISKIISSDLKSYILYLLIEHKVSHSYASQAICVIKFLCNEVFMNKNITVQIPRPKKR